MKETRFIAQNKEKWQEAETLLNSPVKDPEKLGNLFVQVVDDLSYSRTYYPNRSVRVYLNKIARQYFSIIYSNKKEKRSQFKLFWFDELPQIVIHCKKELIVALLVFVAAFSIGVFSSIKDPQFLGTIVGQDYIEKTEENISKGDPMAIYKSKNEVDMFLGITLNNLMVAFRTYVLGIFLGIGTLGSLLLNGVMVGAFQYYFIDRGLFVESALTIWLHGTIEISSIILAGGAGLTLARGLIFPGTYSRLQSLQISGIRSLKLMLGIAPLFVLAGIIESFLTRYTEAPTFVRLSLIILSAAFIVGYFVVYPWLKSRKGFEVPLKAVRLQASINEPVNFKRVKNNADLLKDTFQFYARHNSSILPWAFVVSIAVTAFSTFFQPESFIFDERDWWVTLFSEMFYALETPAPLFILSNGVGTGILLYRVMSLIAADAQNSKATWDTKAFVQMVVLSTIIYSGIYFGLLGVFFAICAFGIIVFVGFVQLYEKANLLYSVGRGWDLFIRQNNQGLSLQFIVLLLSFSFLLLLSAPLLYMHTSVVQWNFLQTEPWAQKAIRFIESFAKIFSLYLILPLIGSSISYLYFTQDEVESANSLKESIAAMGTRQLKNAKR
jgi:uncharacterized membrane protein SpoIIM required for sporulation